MNKNLAESLISPLISLLKQEYKFYEDLKQLLEEERNCIVAMQNEELTNINFRKESLLLNILEVKKEREDITLKISEFLNVNDDTITLTFLSQTFPEYSKIFNEFKDKFKKIAEKIKSLNDINKHILNSSLNFIKSSLNIIYQNSDKAVYTNYGKVYVNKHYIAKSSYNNRI